MKKRLLFVYNPNSGLGIVDTYIERINKIFVSGGYETEILPTQKKGDATDIIRERAREFDIVACSGGDGTLNETINGMMHSEVKIPIGYIPSGSTNDYGTSIGLSKNILKGASQVINGTPIPVDVGCQDDRYFVYVAGFGIFTDISYSTSQTLKNIMGYAAYVLSAARVLSDIPNYKLQIESDEGVLYGDFILGLITNSKQVAGIKAIIQGDVRFSDGLFEVLLVRTPRNPIELSQIMASLTSLNDDKKLIYSFKTSFLKVTSNVNIPWTVDGEFGGDKSKTFIKIEKQAVKIIV